MTQYEQVAITSRAFCLASIVALSLIVSGISTIGVVIVVAITASMAAYVSLNGFVSQLWVLTAEMLVVGLVIGLALPESLILLPYPVVLALLAGLHRGARGALLTFSAELLAVVLVPFTSLGLVDTRAEATALAPWLLTSLGAGLLGAWIKSIGKSPATQPGDSSYASARRLLTQLRVVARRLSAGLDAGSISVQLISEVAPSLGCSTAAVLVKSETGILTRLAVSGEHASELLDGMQSMVDECWSSMEPTTGIVATGQAEHRYRAVLPLRVGSRMVGVLIGAAGEAVDATKLRQVTEVTDDHSIRIDTALLFDEIRSLATVDERQRIAREIHDGVAQDVASLGYLIDELTASTSDDQQIQRLRELRHELSRIVTELRLSIFDLRSEVAANSTLGKALSDYVSQIGAKSDLKVHLSLDEGSARLSAAVESELFRIAQEAITNARKHSGAENLWVDCWIDPPSARLTVRDDGMGFGPRRADSYGVSIMKERACRIDGTLEVGTANPVDERQGTIVCVTIGSASSTVKESGMSGPS